MELYKDCESQISVNSFKDQMPPRCSPIWARM